jgi:hypothetical protein
MTMEQPALSRRAFIAGTVVAATTRPTALSARDAPFKIGVGSDPVFSSFYLAAHEKMFEAEKLHVAVQLYADGGEAMNALVARRSIWRRPSSRPTWSGLRAPRCGRSRWSISPAVTSRW